MAIELDIDEFRNSFEAFVDPNVYTDAEIQTFWNSAICYISNEDYGSLSGDCRRAAINLMVAHLMKLSIMIQAGQTPGYVQSAGVDKVSVSLTPPPARNQFAWWLSLTPYGTQLQAMLASNSVGGFYIGGRPETAAFRKVGGSF